MLKVHAATEKRAKELPEVEARHESTEQMRFEETMQKQALQNALEKEKNKLLSEIAGPERRATKAEDDAERLHIRSEFKG